MVECTQRDQKRGGTMRDCEDLDMEQILALTDLFQADRPLGSRPGRKGLPKDITEIEEQDIQAARDIMSFMEKMPGGFLIYRASEGEEIIYANGELMRIFRCGNMEEFRQLTGNSFRGMVHSEDLDAVEESIREQITSSRFDLDYVEYRIVRKDGSIGWVDDYGHFVHSDIVGDIFYVFVVDATEKKERQQMEQILRRQEQERGEQRWKDLIEKYDKERSQLNQEYLRRLEIIEGLSVNYDSIFYADLDTNTVLPYRLSGRAESVFDDRAIMEYSKFILSYVDKCVHPEDQARVAREASLDGIRQKLANDLTFYLNYRVIGDESVEYLQVRFVNVGREDQVSQIVLGSRRVDEEIEKELEQRRLLEEALHNANASIAAKDSFLSNMSHDMRTPLNAIFGFTALARRHLDDQDLVSEYLDRIESSGRLLLDLIDKVLKLSWMDSNEPRVEETPCSLEAILRGVQDFLMPQAEEKGLNFTLDCSQVQHDAIYGDQEKLSQLVMYLANNAVTYTPSGGSVSLRAVESEALSVDSAIYRIEVEDTGIGISEEFIHEIFDPFTRERNTTLSGIHGIGLGLTIAKNLAELLGGDIEVESEVDKGSTFTVLLRLRQQTEEKTEPEPEEDNWEESNCRILLVEDNEINLEIERTILTHMGFPVEVAEDGSIAVEKVKAAGPGAYDLILMDIQMPVMNGWEATETIRTLPDPALSHIPILALSANVFESDIQKSREVGMDAHLAKPIDVPLLLRTIREVVSRRRAEV